MIRNTCILILLCFLVFPAFGQVSEMTLEDAILGPYTKFRREHINQLTWRGESDEEFSYVKDKALFTENLKGASSELLSLDDLNKAIGVKQLRELNNFPAINWKRNQVIWFRNNETFYTFSLNNKEITSVIKIPVGGKNADYSPKGDRLAITIGNKLQVVTANQIIDVSTEESDDVVFGQTVHRNEFGISKGTFWSPEGNFLAFYRKDESSVEDYPIVDFLGETAKLDKSKYPMAGRKSEKVKVGIFNVDTRETIYLNIGAPEDRYLTNVSWSPDSKYVFIAELNREQNHMQLNQYNVATGNFVKTIFEERNSKYIEPQHPLIFSKKDPNVFYWLSRVDGYFHVYYCHVGEGKIKQVTKGEWEVTEVLGFDEKEKYMYFIGTKESPTDRNLYKVSVNSGEISRLEQTAGTHSALLSHSGKNILDTYESFDVPRVINLVNSKGKILRNLLTASDPMADYKFGENEIFSVDSEDGVSELYCRMIKPANFDDTKKYPVIVYVYGGPHAQLVRNRWHNGARFWQYYMAQKGYIAFTLDNRGSANRGAEFENAVHRQLGIKETADQMKGIEYLKSLPFVDETRIGVHGWSFGGFMTLNLMLRHPEIFKVGVAGGPVVDWKLYEVMYGERYMDTPQENPEGYNETNMLNHVGNLQGKLMLIHGVMDKTVVMQHSMLFLRECIKQKKQVDFFCYPKAEHNVRGVDRVHLMEKVSQYFIDNL